MKRLYTFIAALFVTAVTFSQPLNNGATGPAGIKLDKGQKIIIENTTTIDASLAMGMELNGNSIAVNSLEVKNTTDQNYTISNTLTKLKANMNMMGQANNYDSDNRESNNEEMAKVFDNAINNPADVVLDNTTGKTKAGSKKIKRTDTDEANPAADLMKMFADNSDEAIVSGAFVLIPNGKKTGEQWSDTSSAKDLKTIRKYTLAAVTGNEATIQLDAVTTALNKMDFQGMAFELKTETITKGEIQVDINTGLVKKRTTAAEITGSLPMMGQDMPISAKVASTSIYN